VLWPGITLFKPNSSRKRVTRLRREELNKTTELMQEGNADGWIKKFEEKLF
jgi:hypothetical protein